MTHLMKSVRETVFVRAFTWLKIPLIAHLRPTVLELSNERCAIRFPLTRRSKNHLGAMYFGALCVGADVAGGLMAMKLANQHKPKIDFVFKDFHAEFLKRAHADVVLTCEDGAIISDLVERAAAGNERVNDTVTVIATAPDASGDEPIGRFKLTISLKKRQ